MRAVALIKKLRGQSVLRKKTYRKKYVFFRSFFLSRGPSGGQSEKGHFFADCPPTACGKPDFPEGS